MTARQRTTTQILPECLVTGADPQNARSALQLRCFRIGDRLAFLHAAKTIEDMDRPGYRLHQLTGDRGGNCAVDISRNWRIVFAFDRGDAYLVNYEDYH